MIILDTNVFSEAHKPAPSHIVLSWLAEQDAAAIYITAITKAEVLYGVEKLPAGKRRLSLAEAIEQTFVEDFKGRILPFHAEAAHVFAKLYQGREAIGRPISQFDAMIAAIARCHRAVVATRNTGDFDHCGIRLVNPWIPNE